MTVETDDNASCIFLETLRDVGHRNSVDREHVIAHEIGHAGGPNIDPNTEHAELGIMSEVPATGVGMNAYLPATLLRVRGCNKW